VSAGLRDTIPAPPATETPAGPTTTDIDEVGRRRPEWSQLEHLVTGARQRGFTSAQCEYLTSCIGIAWAKGSFAAEARALDELRELAAVAPRGGAR